MTLPRGEHALIDETKLRDYCLSATHATGKHKARVFRSALDMTARDSEELQNALREAAVRETATRGASDEYGVRYMIDFRLVRNSRAAMIRSSWIVPKNEDLPRFVTCYVL